MRDRFDLPLAGRSFSVSGDSSTAAHARRLLADLGAELSAGGDSAPLSVDLADAPTALDDWASCGAMALTGRPGGPPVAAPGNVAGAVRAALAVFAALCAEATGVRPPLPGVELLGERAALAGLPRRGPWSCGGSFRMLPTRDGSLGMSLPRDDDLALVPALVEGAGEGLDAWARVAAWARGNTAAAAADRAQLLGLAAAAVRAGGATDDEQARHRAELAGSRHTGVITRAGGRRAVSGLRPLVIDLTSLWAGPLCAHLLGLAGADVIKVESTRRPDGARFGTPAFFDLLHAGHASVALNLTSTEGVATLRRLVEHADVVLEASRPRALRQLGIDAEKAVGDGTIWTSITAYGRTGPWANRVGFGDDVAAAAGLVAPDGPDLLPCGDAIADPVTGVHAAMATAAALLGDPDRAHLIDVSMRDVTAATLGEPVEPHRVRGGDDIGWRVETDHASFAVRAPWARTADRPAARLGRDTERMLDRLGIA